MSISLYLESQLEYLHDGFNLDLIMTCELPEHFYYTGFVYEMLQVNRQQLVGKYAGGKDYLRFVNFESLKDSHDYFIQKREGLS